MASSLLRTSESTTRFGGSHERKKTDRLCAAFCRAPSRVRDDAERSALRAACRTTRATAVSKPAAQSGASAIAAIQAGTGPISTGAGPPGSAAAAARSSGLHRHDREVRRQVCVAGFGKQHDLRYRSPGRSEAVRRQESSRAWNPGFQRQDDPCSIGSLKSDTNTRNITKGPDYRPFCIGNYTGHSCVFSA